MRVTFMFARDGKIAHVFIKYQTFSTNFKPRATVVSVPHRHLLLKFVRSKLGYVRTDRSTQQDTPLTFV